MPLISSYMWGAPWETSDRDYLYSSSHFQGSLNKSMTILNEFKMFALRNEKQSRQFHFGLMQSKSDQFICQIGK